MARTFARVDDNVRARRQSVVESRLSLADRTPLRRGKPDSPDAIAGPLELPGLYRPQVAPPRGASHDDPSLAFVALLDPKESDLRRVDESELKAQLGGAGSAQVAASSEAAQGAHGTPLWSALLLVGALALLGEGALTRR